MDMQTSWPPLTDAERDRLRECAMRDAPELRRAAIDAFWRGAGIGLDGSALAARRAAQRLAARLREHAKRRGEAAQQRAIDGCSQSINLSPSGSASPNTPR